MDFPRAFELVVGIEAGYVNDPRDDGGETKYGISKRAYPHLDIKSLTLEDARAIYRRDYWERAGCDRLPSALTLTVFECAVVSGVRYAVMNLQSSLGVPADGVVGPKTIGAALRADPEELLARYNAKRIVRMARDDDWPWAGEGWAYRLFKLARAAD